MVAPQGRAAELPNGIVLPKVWPPVRGELTREPLGQPPYLEAPPECIAIDVGRQLFVDDFLIDATTLKRTFHRPEYHAASPVLVPDKPWEGEGGRARAGCSATASGSTRQDKLFKMWYWASSSSTEPLRYDTCLATSRDGVHWDKPALDVVPGTNIVLRDEEGVRRNSSTVWLDHFDKDPPAALQDVPRGASGRNCRNRVRVSFSADGIHWTVRRRDGRRAATARPSSTTPSARSGSTACATAATEMGRCRAYVETADPLPRGRWPQANQGRGRSGGSAPTGSTPTAADLKLRRGRSGPGTSCPRSSTTWTASPTRA